MPLAVSATTRSGRSVADVDERHDVVDERRQQIVLAAPAGARRGQRTVAVEHRAGDRLDLAEAVPRRPGGRPPGTA